jgi:hypothetical protein
VTRNYFNNAGEKDLEWNLSRHKGKRKRSGGAGGREWAMGKGNWDCMVGRLCLAASGDMAKLLIKSSNRNFGKKVQPIFYSRYPAPKTELGEQLSREYVLEVPKQDGRRDAFVVKILACIKNSR